MSELWIGDEVKILSTGKKGKFEGLVDGKAKIKLGRTHIMIAANDLAIWEEEIPEPDIEYQEFEDKPEPEAKKREERVEAFYFNEPSAEVTEEEFDLDQSLEFRRKIDLHIENYTDYNPRMWVNGALGFQVHKCKKHLNMAIALRVPRVEIVYGIGQGILKKHVLDLLNTYQEVDRISELNSGSSEVWLRY